MVTKGNLFTSRTSNFRCHFVCLFSARRSRIALVCHARWRNLYWKCQIWIFRWNQPHYWKRGQLQSPTTIMGPVRILLLLLYRRLLVRNRMYTWLNKRCVLLLNISNKQKKVTTFLIQIERRRSHVEAAQFCWFVAPCQNELVNVCSWKNDLWNKTASSIWVQFDKTFNLQV